MNETVGLSSRQKSILNILAQSDKLSRKQIAKKLSISHPTSKATLARDLATLLKGGRIEALGDGPKRVYQSSISNPLLKYVDLGQYFALDPDDRQDAKTSFNLDIYTELHDLILPEEIEELKTTFRSYTQSTESLDQTIRDRELERFMIELSWKSSKIEGNTYSLLETETLIKENQEAQGHSKSEALMILNHKDAFKTIVKHRSDFRELSLGKVLELHNILVKDLSIVTGIRTHAVGITGTSYRPLDNEWQIKKSLERLISTVNETTHPFEKALIISSMLAYLQPFADGNKRTARMLSNAVLLAYDYFPLSYRSVDENEFKSALVLFYEINNLYRIKRLLLDQYRFALKTYFV
jgi:Fic family protein